MTRVLPWILAATLTVALVFACQELLDTEKNLTNERNAIQRQADSLRTVNAQLSDSVEVHKHKVR